MFFTYLLIVRLVLLLEEVLGEIWEGYGGSSLLKTHLLRSKC